MCAEPEAQKSTSVLLSLLCCGWHKLPPGLLLPVPLTWLLKYWGWGRTQFSLEKNQLSLEWKQWKICLHADTGAYQQWLTQFMFHKHSLVH